MTLYKSVRNVSFFLILVLSLGLSDLFAGDDKTNNKKNIVEVAVEAGNFTTLAAALQATGLDAELQKEGPFTVFAPTDEAFAKLPEGTVENLLKDTETLKSILLYHVVAGKVMSTDVVTLTEASTVSGDMLKIKTDDNGVMINGSKVIAVDVEASNGVIHVIDTVLIPEKK